MGSILRRNLTSGRQGTRSFSRSIEIFESFPDLQEINRKDSRQTAVRLSSGPGGESPSKVPKHLPEVICQEGVKGQEVPFSACSQTISDEMVTPQNFRGEDPIQTTSSMSRYMHGCLPQRLGNSFLGWQRVTGSMVRESPWSAYKHPGVSCGVYSLEEAQASKELSHQDTLRQLHSGSMPEPKEIGKIMAVKLLDSLHSYPSEAEKYSNFGLPRTGHTERDSGRSVEGNSSLVRMVPRS